MQNFDTIDKEIFEKKTEQNNAYYNNHSSSMTHNNNSNPYFPMGQLSKAIKLSSEIDKIWNSKHNPDFINKIFLWTGKNRC